MLYLDIFILLIYLHSTEIITNCMKTSFLLRFTTLSLLIVLISSCIKEKQPHFTLEGIVTGADSTTLYLEKITLNETVLLDSVRLNSEGEFEFEQPAPQYGDFYLLKLGNQSINIAVDSIETIKINADKATFASKYTVTGSENTTKIKEVVLAQNKLRTCMKSLTVELDEGKISQTDYVTKMQACIDDYRTLATGIIRADYNSLAAYYALFQKVGDLLIFDPYEKSDRSLFQATATVWNQSRPESPRTVQLEKFVLAVLAEVRNEAKLTEKLNNETQVASEDIANFYNISLPDMNGKTLDLGSLKGKVILLDFTAYQADYSPAHNILLNKVYEKYKSKLEIYQVSLDNDEHIWKNTATNLPWLCVRDDRSLSSPYITKFNVRGLPTTFLINKNGDIQQRIFTFEDIDTVLKKVL